MPGFMRDTPRPIRPLPSVPDRRVDAAPNGPPRRRVDQACLPQPGGPQPDTSSSTFSTCPSTFTLRNILEIRPSPSMTKVVRSIPMYFRP